MLGGLMAFAGTLDLLAAAAGSKTPPLTDWLTDEIRATYGARKG